MPDLRPQWQAFMESADLQAWEFLTRDRPPRARLKYERDGVGAIFERLEVLRELNEALLHHYTAVARALAMARANLVEARAAVDDKMQVQRIGDMVSRGMAYDERRVIHDTNALDEALWRRRFEKLAEQLRGTDFVLRQTMDVVKAERMDLSTQSRLIQVGMEIGLH